MTRYTDHAGQLSLLCDHCRNELPLGSSAYSVTVGKIDEGHLIRDYNKGEIVVCPVCATHITRLASLLTDIGLRGNYACHFNTTVTNAIQEVFL